MFDHRSKIWKKKYQIERNKQSDENNATIVSRWGFELPYIAKATPSAPLRHLGDWIWLLAKFSKLRTGG